MSWLPDDFVHPVRVAVPGTELHDLVGGDAERALDVLVPRWIAADWPFQQPRYLGRDITWGDWLALPPAS